MSASWNRVHEKLPPLGEEVLVWIDGHRGPSWRNNYALVAYLSPNGKWYEERHYEGGPLTGVLAWTEIELPDNDVIS